MILPKLAISIDPDGDLVSCFALGWHVIRELVKEFIECFAVVACLPRG